MKQKLSQHVVNSIFYVIYFMFLAQSLRVFSGQLSFKGLNFTNRACFSVRVFKNKYRLFKVSSRSNENARDPTLNRELNRVHLMSMTSINIQPFVMRKSICRNVSATLFRTKQTSTTNYSSQIPRDCLCIVARGRL